MNGKRWRNVLFVSKFQMWKIGKKVKYFAMIVVRIHEGEHKKLFETYCACVVAPEIQAVE